MAILKIRDENGNVQEVPVIKGDKGDAGYTPVKGKDYYTEGEIAEIVQLVLSALPTYNGEVESV